MADTTYTDFITAITADTMNDLNRLHYTILGDPANIAAIVALLIANPAVGQVLQVVHATDAGSAHNGTSLTNLNQSVISITPKNTSSRLVIEVQFNGTENVVSATNSSASFRLYDVTNAADIGELNTLTAAAESQGAAIEAPCCIRASIANAVTTSRSFELRGLTSSAAANVEATSMVWTITEIKV